MRAKIVILLSLNYGLSSQTGSSMVEPAYALYYIDQSVKPQSNALIKVVWAAAIVLNHQYGAWPLKSTGRHGHFLNSTCDIGLSDMQQGLKIIAKCDIAFA